MILLSPLRMAHTTLCIRLTASLSRKVRVLELTCGYAINPYQSSVCWCADDEFFHEKANSANCKDSVLYSGNLSGVRIFDTSNSHEKVEAGNGTNQICKYDSIAFFRSEKYLRRGIPEEPFVQYNAQTSFLDLSQVYGHTASKIKFLRSFEVSHIQFESSIANLHFITDSLVEWKEAQSE